jgi:uncharacterized hydrophobic protein (TIGR00271 family)
MKEKKEIHEEKIIQSKQEAKKNMDELAKSSKNFFKDLLDIRHDTDIDATIKSIKDNIAMKGHTAWILGFSILVASIGLNVSSTAVVIGAMLISPLMGPILGIGLSIGINDIDTLKKSMINLGIMLAISLLVSFAFFSIPLFQKLTPELFARTQPDVRDVLIAISGGLALIIAITRPTPQTNTVAGVAIATALMPPLCTAGYGLAVNNLDYFLGAMFLFTINTIFIALATFVIVKYLHFPMVKYINSAKRKRISRFASFVAIIVLGASIYTFYNLYLENKFNDNVENYKLALKDKGYVLIDEDKSDIDFDNKALTLTVFGKVNPDDRKKINKLKSDFNLTEVNLTIHGAIDDSKVINEIQSLREKFAESQKLIEGRDNFIKSKDERIHYLEKELRHIFKSRIPFAKISEEAKINYEELEELSFAKMVKTNFKSMDTITVFTLKWFDTIPKEKVDIQQVKLEKWLKTRLELDTIQIISNK